MYYAICDGVPTTNGPPFRFFKFKTLASMKSCTEIDEYSIVYNGEEPHQLEEVVTFDDLTSIWCSFGLEPKKFAGHSHVANHVHELTRNRATFWKPKKEETMNDAVQIDNDAVDQFNNKAQKAEKEVRPRLEKTTKIVALVDAPPIRLGTNRYRNMEIVMGCATVAEVIEKLGGYASSWHIHHAVKSGAIKLEE